MTNQSQARRTVHWLLVFVTALFLVTGFGITEFRLIETLTLGLLTKSISQRLHLLLWVPFIILLALHVYLTPRRDSGKNKTKASDT